MATGSPATGGTSSSTEPVSERSSDDEEGSSDSSSKVSVPIPAAPARFDLKPGEFLHDATKSETLISFARRTCSLSIFNIFYDYTTLIAKDVKVDSYTGDAYPQLNRFADIHCCDHNRVKVKHPTENCDYIHASYVDGFRESPKFILTQAPMDTTVEQFWTMIYQEEIMIIVSLTTMNEQICYRYIPTKLGEEIKIGEFNIEHCGSRQVRGTYDATILYMRKQQEQARKILHFCYFAWSDRGTPIKPTEFQNFITDVNYNRKLLLQKSDKKFSGDGPPLLVHCLTGVGRSGTFAALDICCRKLDYTARNDEPILNVRDTVVRLRTQREFAVQKPEQYLFLYLSAIEYALRQHYFTEIEEIDLSAFVEYEIFP